MNATATHTSTAGHQQAAQEEERAAGGTGHERGEGRELIPVVMGEARFQLNPKSREKQITKD